MTITQRFNGFYHALLEEAFIKLRSISFREWKNPTTGGCLVFYRGATEDGNDYDRAAYPKGTPFERDFGLKTILKNMNTHYGMDGENKVSTVDIENKALCEHIDWFTKILNENGEEFAHDIEKWERIKREAGF